MATLLIVDDEELDRQAAARCLRDLDLTIREATDGGAALAAIEDEPPDLVLTDLRMPEVDGLELVRTLQEDRPHLPVVLMTSRGSERVAVEALKAGAASYVPKHDLKEHLADTVMQVLELAEARRTQSRVLGHFAGGEQRFELPSDLALISPLASFLQESLQRLDFGNESLRAQVGMALVEALANAMVHGNLEVGSDLRARDRQAYQDLISKRRQSSPWSQRRVECTVRESRDLVEYVIADQGPGFDPEAVLDPADPENTLRVSGRGILLIRTFMDAVAFNEKGNVITMTKANPTPPAAAS